MGASGRQVLVAAVCVVALLTIGAGQAALDAGRDTATIGMEGRIIYAGDLDTVVREFSGWKNAGATHVSISTMDAGLATVDDHLAVLSSVAESLL